MLEKIDSKKLADLGVLLIGGAWLLGTCSFLGMMIVSHYELAYSLSILLCLGVSPYMYIEHTHTVWNRELPSYFRGCRLFATLAVSLLVIINLFSAQKPLIVLIFIGMKYFIVAICEEILFRYYVQRLLQEQFSKWLAILLQALLFAFLFHSGMPLLLNLLIRLPAGILLTLLFHRTSNLTLLVVIHFLYDAIIHVIEGV